ncbi:MAG TPA: aminopeptidase N, partial [Pseudomonadales bacterium]|nr:aminopeptidase N [Pseudomonadales bacterium]
MNHPAPQPVLLSDYRPPAFLIDHTRLHFDLDPAATEVTAELTMRRNPAAQATDRLRLDGVELELC